MTREASRNFREKSIIHDRRKRRRVQARAADQSAIQFRLGHESLDIVRFDAAAVDDAAGAGCIGAEFLADLMAEEQVRFRSDFRSGGLAGSDRPYGS